MGKPADEFPATPELNKRLDAGIDANILNEMISTVSFAVSRDDLKPSLTGVYFKFEKESLTAVATDGHRLAKYVRSDFKAGEFQGEVIVPRKFLNIINSYISKDENIQLLLGESVFTATIGADTIYTRIIDERFPDYQSVIPTDNEKEIRASCTDLLSAVKRVSIFSNKATHQIAIRASNGSATITTEDPEKASKAQETINIEYDGESIDVGYNAAYLKDILAHMKSDEIVIKLNTPISAGLFYPTLTLWPTAVGKQIADNTTAQDVKHGTLIVRAKSPAWAQELQLKKKEILSTLNSGLGKKTIKDIRFI